MFTHREGDPEPSVPFGTFLGELTDEIAGYMKAPGSKGISAVFLSPKCYALTMQAPDGRVETILKCKGITMCAAASRTLTPERMRQMAERHVEHLLQYGGGGDDTNVTHVQQLLFYAHKATQAVFTTETAKIVRVLNDKRVAVGNDTRAIGTCAPPA